MTDRPTSAPPTPRGAAGLSLLSRLSIHAFCEDQGTADALAEVSADRRLAKSHITTHMGGIHHAKSFYEKAPTPNLLVVESLLDGAGMLADLESLALVCEPETKVMVIGHINDVLLYRELMRRGVSDYLVAPIPAKQLADAMLGVFAAEPAQPPGRVIAFVGAKGGAGSSTVCHNVGWTLAEVLASPTVIADLDLAFGTLGLNFNQDPPQGIAEALAGADRLDGAMTDRLLSKCSERLSLMTAPCLLAQDAEVPPEAAARLIEALSQSASNVALDLPRRWTTWLRQAVAQADEVVITAEPDLANLRNAKNLIDAIAEARAMARPPLLVLNRAGIPRRPEIAPRDFATAVDLQPAAVIEFEPALFGSAANNGLMIGETARKAKPAEQFRHLGTLLTRKTVQARPAEGFFGPIVNRLMRKTGA